MDGTALKTARVLKIYSRLVNGDVLRKKNLRNNFMSRNGVFSVTWNRCAVFLQSRDCSRILSMTKRQRATDWSAPPVLC